MLGQGWDRVWKRSQSSESEPGVEAEKKLRAKGRTESQW